MKVFLSWSGARSKALADELAEWLPRVIQDLEPWMSARSMPLGKGWYSKLEQALDDCQCAIICVTPENSTSPWLLFEAGALSRAYRDSVAIPLYCGLTPDDAIGPLAQLHGTSATEDGLRGLVVELNNRIAKPLKALDLDDAFNNRWPRLHGVLQRLEANATTPGAGVVRVSRVLLAVTPDFQPPEMLADQDQEILERCFPGKVTVQRPTSIEELSTVLMSSTFDIVHLLALVEPETGRVLFGNGESLTAEGLHKLLVRADTKFIFLATCDSMILGAEIARSLSVVAALGMVKADLITSWQRIFYRLLTSGRPLSEAYQVARATSDQPIVLLLRNDTRFVLDEFNASSSSIAA